MRRSRPSWRGPLATSCVWWQLPRRGPTWCGRLRLPWPSIECSQSLFGRSPSNLGIGLIDRRLCLAMTPHRLIVLTRWVVGYCLLVPAIASDLCAAVVCAIVPHLAGRRILISASFLVCFIAVLASMAFYASSMEDAASVRASLADALSSAVSASSTNDPNDSLSRFELNSIINTLRNASTTQSKPMRFVIEIHKGSMWSAFRGFLFAAWVIFHCCITCCTACVHMIAIWPRVCFVGAWVVVLVGLAVL